MSCWVCRCHTVAVGQSSSQPICTQIHAQNVQCETLPSILLHVWNVALSTLSGSHAALTALEDCLTFTAAHYMQGKTSSSNSVTSTFQWLQQMLAGLQVSNGWRASHIHLFGFSQGGSAALHLALHCRSAIVHALSGRCLHLAALVCCILVPCTHVAAATYSTCVD